MPRFWLTIAAATLSLSGCVTGPHSSPPAGVITQAAAASGATATIVVTPCPHLTEAYTMAQQRQAAEELAALPTGSVIARMVGEDIALRDQVRACRGEQHQ